MKKNLHLQKSLFALLLALFMGMGTTYAADFSAVCSTGQTLYYNIIDATNHYVAITFPGTVNNWYEGYTKPTGNITLPSSVTYDGATYTVKEIDWYAFYNCSGLTGSLVIPNSVTLIDYYAFSGCSGFTGSLTIGNSVTTIGNDAFYGCSGFTGSLTIGNSVTTIGDYAFYGCSGFTGSLTIPNSVTTIGNYTFKNCTGLDGTLTIGNSVTTIGYAAFDGCSGFTGSLTIGNSVTTIGNYAFIHCTGFTGSLTIGNSVTSIGKYAFYECSGFTGSLTIGNSVTTIGNEAFYECSGFTGSLTIGNSVTSIGESAFYGCSGFTGSLTIPNSVTTIGIYAFYVCSGFTGSLTIGNSVTSIGGHAFSYCSGFTGSLTIGSSVTSIGEYAFVGCFDFASMTVLPETPPTLGTHVFSNVPSGIPVYVPCSALEDYQAASGWSSFTNIQCYDPLTYSINSDGVSVTVTGHVDGTAATGPILIPETKAINGVTYTVTAIGDYAFDHCGGLTGSLTIPNTVTTIGEDAFNWCTGFNGTLTLGNSLTTIGEYAFYACTGFTGSLTIPNSVTTIDRYVFYYCTGFTGTLTLGSSLTSLGNGAFYACSGFTGTLTLPNSLTTISGSAFVSCSGFTGALVIPDGVTTIGNSAFSGCSGLTSLILPASVTSLGNYAFGSCEGLTTMTVFPATPPTLGNYVFRDVPTTIPVYVPCGSLEDYQSASGWNAFTNMRCLETMTVYDGTATNNRIPAYIYFFDDFARSQFVVPAADLAEMTGRPISSMTFYTTTQNVPYTTVSDADVYLMEVDYTTISTYEPQASATVVYNGRFSIVNAGSGGEMTIHFSTPYVYQGGNLLVGIDNTEDNGFKNIYFKGQTVSGASISGSNGSSTGTIPATQQDFIPKTSFVYAPSMCAPKTLPYTYGFEDEDEFDCWTMLDCDPYTGRILSYSNQGDYSFCFYYNTNPPQYLISPELKGTIGVDVSFYYKNYSNSYPETFQVGYSTTTQSPTAFTWSDEVTANDQTTWMLYEDFFPVGTKYVAVKYNSYDQGALFLDSFSFTPAFCPPKSLPYTYGFEEEDEFDCWTTLNCDANTGIAASAHLNGSYGFQFWYTTNPPQYLISPRLKSTTEVGVSFFYKNEGNEWPETFSVGYSTTNNSPDAFTWGDVITAQNSAWRLYENTFPAGTRYVAIKHLSYDQNVLNIDNFSFTPAFCPTEDQCELTFELTDSYGDGWNGAAIRVVDEETGIVLATMTNVTHDHANAPITENYTLAVCDGRELRFEWVSGSYDSECSYVVTDVNGDEIFSGSGAMSEPVTYMVDCLETFIFLTDGNWNDGSHWNTGTVPPAGSDVIIQANVTVPAGYLAVANAVSLDGGSITVADGGQLKHNTLDLMVTMKKNIAGYDDANSQNNYYLLAVPFLSVQVPTAMTANPGSDFYRFDPSESGAEWRNHKQEPITFVQRRYGYLYANPESVELSLTGITLSVSNEFTMSYTVDYTEGSSNPSNGWALLGNPFTYNAYVYRFGSNNEFVPMPIMMYDEEGELQTIYGGPVAPMQGFFVHVTETTTVYFSGTGLHEDDYVDLGLPSGLLWATCNVGANAPEEYGDYFAWGETQPKDTYNWSTYQYCNGSSSTLTKYCDNSSYGYNGFTDNLTTLLPEDDAAAANWGGNWRMPTQEEFQELYNNTTVTWTQQNGVNGRLFTASNGNSLFLPAAGRRWDDELYDAGDWGLYWSSSLYSDYPIFAWRFGFNSDNYYMGNRNRYGGLTVRPVREN